MRRAPCSRFPWPRLVAAGVALGLHAAVLAVVLFGPAAVAPSVQPPVFSVTLVESPVETASSSETAPSSELVEQLEGSPSEPEPETMPEPEPRQAPEIQPEPQPAPEPAAVIEKPRPAFPPVVQRPPRTPQARARPQPHIRKATAVAAAKPVAARAPAAGGSTSSAPPAARDPDRPRTIGQANYLGAPPRPVYPRTSERRGEQGRVVLRVLISAQGQVADVTVRRSSGHQRLDDAAIEATRRARFRPYVEDGVAYRALVEIPFDFVLQRGLARK